MYIYSKDIKDLNLDIFIVRTTGKAHLACKVDIFGMSKKDVIKTDQGAMNYIDDKEYDLLKESEIFKRKCEDGTYYLDSEKLPPVEE